MTSSNQGFPVQKFLTCIRQNGNKFKEFIHQVNNLNIQWIYQIIKHCYIILQSKESPSIKLTALSIIKDLMVTCKVPCINLIEVYILPTIYEIAIWKPQESRQQRGTTYFQQYIKTNKTANIEEIGSKYVRLCQQMIFVGALIKPKQILQTRELNTRSDYQDNYQNLQQYEISGISTSITQIKYFSQQFLKKCHQLFLQNIQHFNQLILTKNQFFYSTFFINKIISSLQSNINQNYNHDNLTQLSINKLLKSGDFYITLPLLEQLIKGTKNIKNFIIKKNYFNLLIDFVQWGHVQAIWKLSTDDILFSIGKRIMEVNGKSGLKQGQNIYPQIQQQFQSKRKFYIQYLKSLQILTKCLKIYNFNIPNVQKIILLYQCLKKQKKFQFPQNLKIKSIQSDFKTNAKYNQQRNVIILHHLINNNNNNNNNNHNNNYNNNHNNNIKLNDPLKVLNKKIEQHFELFFKIRKNKQQISNKINKFIQFKQYFYHELDKIQQVNTDLKQSQISQILQNGQQLIKNIDKLQQNYQKYQNQLINLDQFYHSYEQILKYYQDNVDKTYKQSSILNKQKKSQISQKNHPDSDSPKIHRHPTFSQQTPFILPEVNGVHKSPMKTNPDVQVKHSHQPLLKTTSNVNYASKDKIDKKDNNSDKLLTEYNNNEKGKISNNSPFILQNIDEIRNNRMSKSSLQNKKSANQKNLSGFILDEIKNLQKQLQNNHLSNSSESSKQLHQNQTNKININKPTSEKLNIQIIKSGIPNNINFEKSSKTQPLPLRTDIKSQQIKKNNFVLTTPTHTPSPNNIISSDRESATFIIPQSNSPTSPHANSLKSQHNKQISKQSSPSGSNKLNGQLPFFKTVSQNHVQNKQIKASCSLTHNANVQNSQKNNLCKLENINNTQHKQPHQFPQQIYHKQFKQSSDIKNNSEQIPDIIEQYYPKKSQQSDKFSSKSSNISYVKNYNTNNQQFNINTKYQSQVASYDKKITQNSRITTNINSFDKYDEIKQPEWEPLNNSYYQFNSIFNKSNSIQFKDCFQINKQFININNNINYINFHLNQQKVNSQLHQQYLIAKLLRWQSTQQQSQQNKLQNHILQLKRSTSKLKNKLKNQTKQNNKQKNINNQYFIQQSQQQKNIIYFQNSQFNNNSYHNHISPIKYNSFSKSNSSYFLSSTFKEGILINTDNYQSFGNGQYDDKIKKNCLKTKSLIIKNQLYQIGYMIKKTLNHVKVIIYFTPFQTIYQFVYSIAKEPNLQIDSYCKQYTQINANKQIKIQINVSLKNIPYSFPMMNLEFFVKDNNKKTVSFYLPLPVHRFFDVKGIQKSEVEGQLLQNIGNLKRFNEFKINHNVFRHKQMMQYFPNITNISQTPTSHIQKYSLSCTFKNYSFIILIALTGKDRILLQGLSKNQNFFMQYFMISLKKIIEQIQ